eukprot:CAMPEP_0194277936 /NCGR_PEP_ID=MMETSP0169-20130528/10127_1 /TAXON_ID=218684 /ORGANISM="Corethron pennatum, Strain L29A3" /LENGTH=492 /DNA_ID=CAMNT_0039022021 /DNA_START=119 /DNA_END=1597 /DNA_ORIENTATION=+
MALCCFYPSKTYLPNDESSRYDGNSYPGQRQGYPGQQQYGMQGTSQGQMEVPVNPGFSPGQVPSPLQSLNQIISVTVPQGTHAGDTIHVSTPDGRIIEATVPPMHSTGSIFTVEVPAGVAPAAVQCQNPVSAPDDLPVAVAVPIPDADKKQSAGGTAVIVANGCSQAVPPGSVPPSARPQQDGHFAPATKEASAPPGPSCSAAPTQQPQPTLVQVNVPPGTQAGTTLHIRVPGDGRVVAAVVPPGVSQFTVSVPPLDQPAGAQVQNYGQTNNSNNTQELNFGKKQGFAEGFNKIQGNNNGFNKNNGNNNGFNNNSGTNNNNRISNGFNNTGFNNNNGNNNGFNNHNGNNNGFNNNGNNNGFNNNNGNNNGFNNNGNNNRYNQNNGNNNGYNNNNGNNSGYNNNNGNSNGMSPWMLAPAFLGGALVGDIIGHNQASHNNGDGDYNGGGDYSGGGDYNGGENNYGDGGENGGDGTDYGADDFGDGGGGGGGADY